MLKKADLHFIQQLKTTVSNYIELPESEWEKLYPHLTFEIMDREAYFIRAEETPDKIALILSGVFRVFYTSETGTEKTLVFRSSNQFISAYSSFLSSQTSPYTIQAITKSTIIYTPLSCYFELAKNHDCWQALSGRYAEQLFIEKEKRARDLLMLDAAHRYHNFKKDYDHLLDLIPNYMVASYLGITPEALSRIRHQ